MTMISDRQFFSSFDVVWCSNDFNVSIIIVERCLLFEIESSKNFWSWFKFVVRDITKLIWNESKIKVIWILQSIEDHFNSLKKDIKQCFNWKNAINYRDWKLYQFIWKKYQLIWENYQLELKTWKQYSYENQRQIVMQ